MENQNNLVCIKGTNSNVIDSTKIQKLNIKMATASSMQFLIAI